MGTPTQRYVDPAIAANSGTGTIGDPYGDLQFALNSVTRDATNGDQFNVKAGTSEIMAAGLSFATYGTPTQAAPVIIRGYTSAANDGGIGVVSGNASVACIAASGVVSIILIDMRFTNCGAAAIVTTGNQLLVINCEIDTSTGSGLVAGSASHFVNSYIHNTGSSGISCGSDSVITFCTFRNETNAFTQAITANAFSAIVFNIFDLDGASHGILINSDGVFSAFNSIYSNGGTGTGIRNATTTHQNAIIMNNTIAGFSGVGGIGILAAGDNIDIVGYNLLYNNTTNVSITGDDNSNLGNNDTAGAIPFVDAPNDDFDPVAGLSAGYPTTWKNYTATQQNLLRMAAQYKRVARARSGIGLG